MGFALFWLPHSKFFFSAFRIPHSEFFYMLCPLLYALLPATRNLQPVTRNPKPITSNPNKAQSGVRNSEVGPVVVRWGGTMPRLKMRNAENKKKRRAYACDLIWFFSSSSSKSELYRDEGRRRSLYFVTACGTSRKWHWISWSFIQGVRCQVSGRRR